MPDYALYAVAEFLNDASFIRWGKGDAAATVCWEAWLATAPPNAAAARAARQQLRLLLAADPVPVNEHTIHSTWHDINQTIATQQTQVRRRTWQWTAAAAVALAALSTWLLTRRPR